MIKSYFQIAKDANFTPVFIVRNLRLPSPHVKLAVCTSLIPPKTEYASSLWDPFRSNLANTLEAVQNRPVHFILNKYSSSSSIASLKSSLGIPKLYIRRHIPRPSIYHKIFHNHSIRMAYVFNTHPISACLNNSHKTFIVAVAVSFQNHAS